MALSQVELIRRRNNSIVGDRQNLFAITSGDSPHSLSDKNKFRTFNFSEYFSIGKFSNFSFALRMPRFVSNQTPRQATGRPKEQKIGRKDYTQKFARKFWTNWEIDTVYRSRCRTSKSQKIPWEDAGESVQWECSMRMFNGMFIGNARWKSEMCVHKLAITSGSFEEPD